MNLMELVKVVARQDVKVSRLHLFIYTGEYDKVQEKINALKKELFCFLAEFKRYLGLSTFWIGN